MAKKKMNLRLGDLLLDPADRVGVIQYITDNPNDAIVVHWFAENVSYGEHRVMVEYWRQKALDRRADFL